MPPRKRRQRGYIEQLPSGNYRAVAYAGVDLLTRRPRYHRETVKTYDDAKKALVKLQSEIDEDRAPKSDITVRQAIDQWLDLAKLEDTTRERYQDLIRLYILLGRRPTGECRLVPLLRLGPREQPRVVLTT
jgi:hypothetical protein